LEEERSTEVILQSITSNTTRTSTRQNTSSVLHHAIADKATPHQDQGEHPTTMSFTSTPESGRSPKRKRDNDDDAQPHAAAVDAKLAYAYDASDAEQDQEQEQEQPTPPEQASSAEEDEETRLQARHLRRPKPSTTNHISPSAATNAASRP
jgi:hypothetical protein